MARWPGYLARRAQRLAPAEHLGKVPEKVAENIVEDLFADVLDWPLECVNYQVNRADMLLTHNGIKRLLVETKAPGAFCSRSAVERALVQARGYATAQFVKAIAVADGVVLYVADLLGGHCRDRVLVRLDADTPPVDDLWRLSVHGIYRDCPPCMKPLLSQFDGPEATAADPHEEASAQTRLVGGEQRPAECFAFVGDLTRRSTWKLPYLVASGEVDEKRLAMAIGAVLRNYRGQSVSIPAAAVPEVLFRLGRAAWKQRRFPGQVPRAKDVFRDLQDTLLQLGLWDEVQMEEPPTWDAMDRTPGT